MTRRTKLLIVVGSVVGVVILVMGWQGVRAYMAWNSVERVPFDLEEARTAISELPSPEVRATTTTSVPGNDPVEYTSVLVIGSLPSSGSAMRGPERVT